jgi:hypothetical protein
VQRRQARRVGSQLLLRRTLRGQCGHSLILGSRLIGSPNPSAPAAEPGLCS